MNARQRPWTRYLLVIWLTCISFLVISDVLTEPSIWTWIKLALLAMAVPWFLYRYWRPAPVCTVQKIIPASVPAEDVDAVVDEHGRTVKAIRSLRELHPGLGLGDAKNLVRPEL